MNLVIVITRIVAGLVLEPKQEVLDDAEVVVLDSDRVFLGLGRDLEAEIHRGPFGLRGTLDIVNGMDLLDQNLVRLGHARSNRGRPGPVLEGAVRLDNTENGGRIGTGHPETQKGHGLMEGVVHDRVLVTE